MRALLVAAFIFMACPVWAQGNPKLEVGKVYAAVISCQTQLVPVGEGRFQKVPTCYTEAWRILGVGKDGWVRFEDAERGGVWWGNIHRLIAITEVEEQKVEPGKIQA